MDTVKELLNALNLAYIEDYSPFPHKRHFVFDLYVPSHNVLLDYYKKEYEQDAVQKIEELQLYHSDFYYGVFPFDDGKPVGSRIAPLLNHQYAFMFTEEIARAVGLPTEELINQN